jgi:membrane protease subunit (stomatin/prohibitin family)
MTSLNGRAGREVATEVPAGLARAQQLCYNPGTWRATMPDDKKCPECGYLNDAGATFCGNCGSPQRVPGAKPATPPSTLPEEVVPSHEERGENDGQEQQAGGSATSSPAGCPECHYPAEPEDLFCRRCGAKLARRPLFCKRCGDPVDPDESFCNRCGLPLG